MESRRRIERIRLANPLRGTAGVLRVYVLDVSLRGFRIAHRKLFDGVKGCRLSFDWESDPIAADCRIVHTRLQPTATNPLYHSGLEMLHEPPHALRTLVESHVARALDEQKANAGGIPPLAGVFMQSGGATEFVKHELIGGRWRETKTSDPTQSRYGFVIAASTTKDDVALLRDAYERGDASSRHLIREMAALSISSPDVIPIRKYTP